MEPPPPLYASLGRSGEPPSRLAWDNDNTEPAHRFPRRPGWRGRPRPEAMVGPGRYRPGPADGDPGRHDREHRAALGPAGPALQHRGPAVGRDRLRAGLRHPAAARREGLLAAGPE